MICLRSGYCCINYDVIILIDPDKGIAEDNLMHKPNGERCMHLQGEKPGEMSCAIHDHPIYKDTPCFDYGQIEHGNTNCRMGNYILADSQRVKRLALDF